MGSKSTEEASSQLMNVQEAIEKRVPQMRADHHRDSVIIEEKCPKCGSSIVCVYDELGAMDYYDNFAHLCLNPHCDFVCHQEIFSGENSCRTEPGKQVCVFCGREIKLVF